MNTTAANPLKLAMREARSSMFAVGFFSFFINLMMLSGPIYMLQVYDRVLTSNSIETLAALSVMLLILFVAIGCLEFARSRILARVGSQLEARISLPVFDASIRKRIVTSGDDGSEHLSDLTSVRDFLSSNALPAFFDLPWVPIYLLILTILHPALGLLGLGGALFLGALAWANNRSTQAPLAQFAQLAAPARALATSTTRNAATVHAMGMLGDLRAFWSQQMHHANNCKALGTDRASAFAIISKTARLLLQSAALGLGAALVIVGDFTAGAMIAGTIILGRGLAPVDQSIAHWRSLTSTQGAIARLETLLEQHPEPVNRISIPAPTARLDVDKVFAGPPGAEKATISAVNFSLEAGNAVAVIGPSASGKSTLARLLTGIWMPQAGQVRLDDVAYAQWNPGEIGRHVGYLPQDIELFEGTIAQNIARFSNDVADTEIISAAVAAGVHKMILQLPEGYDTDVGEGGRALSGGQRQRIGLARALFRDPFLVVLDEPNANLDSDGDAALAEAIAGIQKRGGIAIVISHRPGIIAAVDTLLMLENGRQRAFGPKEAILASRDPSANKNNVTPLVKRAI